MSSKQVGVTPCKHGHTEGRNNRGECRACRRVYDKRKYEKKKKYRGAPRYLHDAGVAWIQRSHLGLRRRNPGENTVTKQALLALWEAQGGRCALTGLLLGNERPQLDHKVPVSKGGAHTIDNLQWVSRRANHAKNDSTDAEFQEWLLSAAAALTAKRQLEALL